MVNLIPQEAKKSIRTEYYVRVATVWLFLMAAAFLVLCVLLVPVGMLVKLQLAALNDSYSKVAEKEGSYVALEAAVKESNKIADELALINTYAPLWPDVAAVYEAAGADVAISNVTLAREGAVVKALTVTGEAVTREALSEFRDRLEATDRFVSAALPLANLAKNIDIPFSITIATTDK